MELVLLIKKHELLTNSIIKQIIMHKDTHQRRGYQKLDQKHQIFTNNQLLNLFATEHVYRKWNYTMLTSAEKRHVTSISLYKFKKKIQSGLGVVI